MQVCSVDNKKKERRKGRKGTNSVLKKSNKILFYHKTHTTYFILERKEEKNEKQERERDKMTIQNQTPYKKERKKET